MSNQDKVSVKRNLIKDLVASTKGRTFQVTHLRKAPKLNKTTGEMETMSTMDCRTGVTKHLKGGESTIKHVEDLVGVYAVARNEKGQFVEKGYRSFSADLVTEVKFQGVTYNFSE